MLSENPKAIIHIAWFFAFYLSSSSSPSVSTYNHREKRMTGKNMDYFYIFLKLLQYIVHIINPQFIYLNWNYLKLNNLQLIQIKEYHYPMKIWKYTLIELNVYNFSSIFYYKHQLITAYKVFHQDKHCIELDKLHIS